MSTRARRFAAWLAGPVAALLAAVPGPASACAVCLGGPGDRTQTGFLLGSLFLSALPLLLVGALALWIRRRARLLADEAAAGVVRLPEAPARRAPPAGAAQPASR